MGEFIKQLKVENNERISAIKFVSASGTNAYGGSMTMSQSSQRSGGNSSHGSSHQSQNLLVAHSDKISILSAKDNFSKRHTFRISNSIPSPSFTSVSEG